MRWLFDSTPHPEREPGEEELDEVARALMQAADAAPVSPRAEAIRTQLLASLDERQQPRFALVPAMIVVVLLAVIGIGAVIGTQSIGSFVPPPVRTFLEDMLGPERMPPRLPAPDDDDDDVAPDQPGDEAPGDEAPGDEAPGVDDGPPRETPVAVPTPVPAGPPMETPSPGAGEGPPGWVPAPGPPAPTPVTPPPRPTPPQTGPPGDAGP